jgi:putative ABC transport system ATP-binding protein
VDGIDLDIEAGRITVLRGPSGSGKTTLLSLTGCLSRPSSGRVRLHGEDISALPERFLTGLRRHHFGFVFQQFNLIRDLSALENILLPARPTGRPQRAVQAAARALAARFGLERQLATPVAWLSGGEQQRVAIARALINDPEVIIADEPTANLDTALAQQCLNLLAELNADGKTVLLTSHDPLVIQSPLVHRVVSLRDGRLVAD